MGGQSACATPSKSARCGYCSPRAWNPCSCNKSSPHASTKPNPPLTTARESPCTATKTQHSQKKIFFNLEKEKRMSGRGRLYRPLGHCKDFGLCSEYKHWGVLGREVTECDSCFNRISTDALWRLVSQCRWREGLQWKQGSRLRGER